MSVPSICLADSFGFVVCICTFDKRTPIQKVHDRPCVSLTCGSRQTKNDLVIMGMTCNDAPPASPQVVCVSSGTVHARLECRKQVICFFKLKSAQVSYAAQTVSISHIALIKSFGKRRLLHQTIFSNEYDNLAFYCESFTRSAAAWRSTATRWARWARRSRWW